MAQSDEADRPSSKSDSGGSLAEELGRRAGKLAKAAKPHVRRLAAQATPRLQKTGQDAMQYAREHQDEIKDAAAKLARARVGGPLGFVVDAMAKASTAASTDSRASLTCTTCGSENPTAARFCNQCGSGLRPPAE